MSATERREGLVVGFLLLLALAAAIPAREARAACPDNVCDCLGAATQFTTVSNAIRLRSSMDKFGRPYTLNFALYGDVCTGVAAMTASTSGDGPADVLGNVVATESKPGKSAVTFNALKGELNPVFDPSTPLIIIEGDLVTGGGRVTNQSPVPPEILGVVDSSGTNPRLDTCRQAQLDTRAASAALASLPPTQTFPAIKLKGTSMTITAGPGKNVIYIDSIRLEADEFGNGGELFFDTSPTTESIVVNTRKIRVGDFSFLTGPGDSVPGLFNVVTSSAVSLGYLAEVSTILAPRSMIHGTYALSSSNLYGRQIGIDGGISVSDSISCP